MTASSDTPRTDALKYIIDSSNWNDVRGCEVVDACEYAALERELAALREVHSRACGKLVAAGIHSFGTLDEGLGKLCAELAKAKAALTPIGRTSLPESRAEAEHNLVCGCGYPAKPCANLTSCAKFLYIGKGTVG